MFEFNKHKINLIIKCSKDEECQCLDDAKNIELETGFVEVFFIHFIILLNACKIKKS